MKKIYEQINLIAHRGLSGEHCENSYPAFLHACQLPFYGIETDIQFTSDDKIVCFHDKKGKRLLGMKEKIVNVKYKSFKKIPLRNRLKEKVTACTFSHYLKTCRKYKKHCIVELKYNMTTTQIKKVIHQLKFHHCLKRCIIISFNPNLLKFIRNRLPNLNLQLLVKNPLKHYIPFCQKYNISASLNSAIATKDTIERLKKHNIPVAIWTVNNPSTAQKFINQGVNYITSNFLM